MLAGNVVGVSSVYITCCEMWGSVCAKDRLLHIRAQTALPCNTFPSTLELSVTQRHILLTFSEWQFGSLAPTFKFCQPQGGHSPVSHAWSWEGFLLCPHPGGGDCSDRNENKGTLRPHLCGTLEATGSRVLAQVARKRVLLSM